MACLFVFLIMKRWPLLTFAVLLLSVLAGLRWRQQHPTVTLTDARIRATLKAADFGDGLSATGQKQIIDHFWVGPPLPQYEVRQALRSPEVKLDFFLDDGRGEIIWPTGGTTGYFHLELWKDKTSNHKIDSEEKHKVISEETYYLHPITSKFLKKEIQMETYSTSPSASGM